MVDFRLYAITERVGLPQDSLVARIGELVDAGVKAIQLREKDLGGRELLALATQLRAITSAAGARLIINDRIDIAELVDADGLHVPEHSWPLEEARRLLPKRLIARSTHSLEAAKSAERVGADFITFGPIYDTPSKRCYGKPLGLEALKEVTDAISIPVFAIGGITPERAAHCMNVGAFGVAVISDLLYSKDPRSRYEEYSQVLHPVLS